jgi:eukaryotic-like serine/threonine-protein kinase
MPSATPVATPLPLGAAIAPDSLRAAMETKRSNGERFSLAESVAIVVPLAVDLAKHHGTGARFFATPSSIRLGAGEPRVQLDLDRASAQPTLPRDRACLAPETRDGKPGDARASVFALGGILYEMLTGLSVGPGMQRPTLVDPTLPSSLEILLGKALVSESAHRPDDLAALAAAIHHLAPGAAEAPAAADESHLDHDGDFEVDVALSMLPPAPSLDGNRPAMDSYGVAVMTKPAQPATRTDPTSKLADLKARLESDPRPRYVVIQDGMDHGPFSAVELLQQVGTGTFHLDGVLRDLFSKQERPIKDWEEFAPFAEQAKLHREIKAEKQEIERVVAGENKATTSKALIGGGAVALLAGAAAVWFFTTRGSRNDTVEIQGDKAVAVDVDGGVKSSQKTTAAGPGVGGRLPTQGAYPILPGGLSCEGAQAKYVEEMKMGEKGAPDLTAGQFGSVLNNGSYLNACGVPSDTKVNVCAAVQNGRAVGVTVTLNPPNAGMSSCVAGRVRGLSFPSNPKLDIARTAF